MTHAWKQTKAATPVKPVDRTFPQAPLDQGQSAELADAKGQSGVYKCGILADLANLGIVQDASERQLQSGWGVRVRSIAWGLTRPHRPAEVGFANACWYIF